MQTQVPGGHGYAPQIDSLRAFSVIGVLAFHLWLHETPLGHWGVRQFFVISGFLITSILLTTRDRLGEGQTLGRALKIFYIRRALRIFPAYYLLLATVFIFDETARAPIGWHALYLSNILFTIENDWGSLYLAHFWSLSVEVQFYLAWPFVVLCTPRRALPFVLGAVIVAAVVFRIGMTYWPADQAARWVLTPVALDALGIGAALALVERGIGLRRAVLWALAALAGLGIVVYNAPLWNGDHADAAYVWKDFALVFPMVFCLAVCRIGVGGPVGWILDNPALQYVGRISYGLYLYHYPVAAAYLVLAPSLGVEPLGSGHGLFAVILLATLAVAAMSLHFVEQPITRYRPVSQDPQSLSPFR